MKILLVDSPAAALPPLIEDTLRSAGWDVETAGSYQEAIHGARGGVVDTVVFASPSDAAPSARDEGAERDFAYLLRQIEAQRMAAVLFVADPRMARVHAGTMVDVVSPAISADELRGRLSIIDRYHRQFQRMELELRNMERLGKRLNQHFREVDQEMRLAGRLQRDFLPRMGEPIGGVSFAGIYRPASWVSGDIYDVVRVDEEHTAIYVADAVGHGMAASLLTMFIKQAVMPKMVQGSAYTVLTPSETLSHLNHALVEQSLPNCQFVTVCYGLLNHRTRVFRFACGGHPYPLLITEDGAVTDLKSGGGLLGVFKGEEFPTSEVELHPSDKIVLYTDGVELAFSSPEGPAPLSGSHPALFQSFANRPLAEMFRSIEHRLDQEVGSLNPRDDVTIVGLEVLRP